MVTTAQSVRADRRPLQVLELGVVEYRTAWDRQRALARDRLAGGPDRLLLLQHPAVYTAGKRTEPHERPTDPTTPVVDTDRGGKITWHGPGQLVGYPIVTLAQPVDVMRLVHRLEDALIAVCAQFGLPTGRVPGRSGVWVPATAGRPARKIGALGLRVARGTTLHGFALNCDCDLDAFSTIVPCGIADAGVTSLTVELGRPVTVGDVLGPVAAAVTAALDGTVAASAGAVPQAPAADRAIPPAAGLPSTL